MRVEIVEVSPRDGLQNHPQVVPTAAKVNLIRRVAAAGLQRIEVTSFVNPRRVPQMADADEVVAQVKGQVSARLSALVLNEQGAKRAVQAGVDEVTFVQLASETFNLRNQGTSIAGSLEEWRRVAGVCQSANVPTTFMLGAAFGCPFEGEVPADRVLSLMEEALDSRPAEVALADTIGCADPVGVSKMVARLRSLTSVPLRMHLHNTRNSGYANAYAAVAGGVTALDASLGGLGGCPFAPAATGNIATEDLAWMLERSGFPTGASLPTLIDIAEWLPDVGLNTDSLVPRAGVFPPGLV